MRFAGFTALLLLGGLAHAVVARWAHRTFPFFARRKRMTIALAVALTLLAPLARVLSRWTQGLLSAVYALAATEYLAVVLAVFPIAFVAVILDLVIRKKEEPGPVVSAKMTRRQTLEAATGSIVLAGTTGVLGWGAVRGRHAFAIEELVVRIPGLPRALDGYTIGQISDIHVGTLVQERELDEGLSRLREIKADLIVATGDLVDFDPSFIPMLARAFAALRARDGLAAILGNHDYYADARGITAALRSIGVDVLVNQGKVIREGFALLGIDDMWSPRYGGAGARLDLAEKMVPPDMPRIVLSHQPNSVDLWAGRVALQLSGHTHGGQINPGFSPARWVTPYVAGRFDVRGTTLWVNRGFGVAGPPARLNAPPEVTKIVLVSA
jgi:hypothetical protein